MRKKRQISNLNSCYLEKALTSLHYMYKHTYDVVEHVYNCEHNDSMAKDEFEPKLEKEILLKVIITQNSKKSSHIIVPL